LLELGDFATELSFDLENLGELGGSVFHEAAQARDRLLFLEQACLEIGVRLRDVFGAD